MISLELSGGLVATVSPGVIVRGEFVRDSFGLYVVFIV